MKLKKGKIAFVHPDLGIGGAERLILDMANELSDEYTITFLTNHFDPSHAFDELKNGEYKVEVYGDWLPNSIFGKFRAFCAYFRMIYLVLTHLILYRKNCEFDLYIVDLIPIAIPFLRLYNLKVIYYCHHPDLLATSRENLLKKLYRLPIDWIECKATKMCSTILVNSQYTAGIFKQTFPEIENNLQVLYPTISRSVVDLIESNSNQTNISNIVPEITENSFVFLSINRFHPAKNLGVAIEAMNYLKSNLGTNFEKIYLILAGGFDPNSNINLETFNSLRELVHKYNLDDHIVLIKSPTELFKVELLLSCSCLIYTPLKEHFGIVPLEAMMARKPVIGWMSGGPKETIEHGHNGYLCSPEPNDKQIERLAKAMSDIVDSNNSVELGENGYRKLKREFSNEIFKKQLKSIVNDSINLI